MLSDKPLDEIGEDRLGFLAYADALAELLDHPDTDTPLTIAINAQWGAGKTSLAKMAEARLVERAIQRGDRPYVRCWFNATRSQKQPKARCKMSASSSDS
jgi:hypothetical protein